MNSKHTILLCRAVVSHSRDPQTLSNKLHKLVRQENFIFKKSFYGEVFKNKTQWGLRFCRLSRNSFFQKCFLCIGILLITERLFHATNSLHSSLALHKITCNTETRQEVKYNRKPLVSGLTPFTLMFFLKKIWYTWPLSSTVYNQKSRFLLVGSWTTAIYRPLNANFSMNFFNGS